MGTFSGDSDLRLPFYVRSYPENWEVLGVPRATLWSILSEECFGIEVMCAGRIHAFLMMPNYFEMILSCGALDVHAAMQYYAWYVYHALRSKTGREAVLFSGHYRYCPLRSATDFEKAVRCLYRRPIHAGLADRVEDYPFSLISHLRNGWQLPFSPHPFPLHYELKSMPREADRFLEWLNGDGRVAEG